MIDFETPEAEEPLLAFQIPNEEEDPNAGYIRQLVDMDVLNRSEEQILLCFQDDAIGFLNLPAKEFKVINTPLNINAAGEINRNRLNFFQFGSARYLNAMPQLGYFFIETTAR